MKVSKIAFPFVFFLMTATLLGFGWGKKTLKELTTSAPTIVTGTVQDVNSRFEKYAGRDDFIVTYSSVRVEGSLKGNVSEQIITVKTPGGQIGERGMGGEGSFRFSKNEEVILFLKFNSTGYYEVYGLAGKLGSKRINGDKYVDCSSLKDDEVTLYRQGTVLKTEDVVSRIRVYLTESKRGGISK